MRPILIFKPCPAFGRMYLCRDGSLSSAREHAAEHHSTQFNAVVAENWIVGENACAELVVRHGERPACHDLTLSCQMANQPHKWYWCKGCRQWLRNSSSEPDKE